MRRVALITRLLTEYKAFPIEFAHARPRHDDPFGPQKGAFHSLAAAVTSEAPPSRDNSMARHTGCPTALHDVTDRARRAWRAGRRGDVAVGGDASRGDAPDRGEYTLTKLACRCLFHENQEIMRPGDQETTRTFSECL